MAEKKTDRLRLSLCLAAIGQSDGGLGVAVARLVSLPVAFLRAQT